MDRREGRGSRWSKIALLLVVLLTIAISGICLHAAPLEDAALVFPPPPEQARLTHLTDLDGGTGFTERRSLWQKVASIFTGEDPPLALSRPLGAAAAGGIVYVCDPGGQCVHCFRESDSTRFRIPRRGEQLPSPIDVAVDPRGRIYVSDSRLAEVRCYDPEGSLLFRCQGEFERPTGLAYHRTLDRLLIVETLQHRVLVYAADGRRVGEFGGRGEGEGEFNFPTAVAVDRDGRVLVVDSLNFRIQIFTPSGEFIRAFGKPGDGPGSFSRPKGVASDSDGNIYVVDALQDALQIFDHEGQLLLFIGGPGRESGKFWLPGSVTVDDRDRVLVSDTYNNRVQVFQVHADRGASSWLD